MEKMLDYFRAAGDLLLPRACLVCGARLGLRERHLCLSCAADVPYTYHWLQPHNPMADRFNAVLERHRGTEPMDYAYAVSLMYYKGPYRSIPRALKYHSDLAAGRFYATLLGRHIAAAPHFADMDLILPVPLHWTRRWSRGYNQAEVLARAIASVLSENHPALSKGLSAIPGTPSVILGEAKESVAPVPCRVDLLMRTRRTRSQTRMSVAEKASNVDSAFRVPSRPFRFASFRHFQGDRESPVSALARARHILLVDDTFTTGATLCACYAALRPFTQARISIATLAVVEGTPAIAPCSGKGSSATAGNQGTQMPGEQAMPQFKGP